MSRAKRRAVAFARLVGRGSVYGACGAITLLILANSYEIAFGRTLPFVHAITKVDLHFLTPSPNTQPTSLAGQTSDTLEGNYGAPLEVKVGSGPVRIPVGEPLYRDGSWIARASTAHYIITSRAKTGNIGDLVLYMTSGKTTIADPAAIAEGANIFLYTKRDWRYLYKIDEVAPLGNSNQRYVLPASKDTSRIYIVVQQPTGRTVIAGSLTNVQNANQL